jgi:hypothetical protein
VQIHRWLRRFFGVAAQAIHGRQIIGRGNSANSALFGVIRGQNFGCGGAALGNPRLEFQHENHPRPRETSRAFCETIGCCPVLYSMAKNVVLDR